MQDEPLVATEAFSLHNIKLYRQPASCTVNTVSNGNATLPNSGHILLHNQAQYLQPGPLGGYVSKEHQSNNIYLKQQQPQPQQLIGQDVDHLRFQAHADTIGIRRRGRLENCASDANNNWR